MKKILFTILTFFIAIIFTIAETPEELYPYVKPISGTPNECIAITGNGKNRGDEIACGTEHFYVIANQDGMIKALAKYNLNLGNIAEKISYNGYRSKYDDPTIKEKILQGYTFEDPYSESLESGEYIIQKDNVGILNYYSKNLYDSSNPYAVLEEEEAQKKLSEGYRPISRGGNKYDVIKFQKRMDIENKTLFLDGTEMSEEEMLNLDEVKELLNQGYEYDPNSKNFNQSKWYRGEGNRYSFRYVFFTKRTNKYDNITQLTTNSPIQVIGDKSNYSNLGSEKYIYPKENVITSISNNFKLESQPSYHSKEGYYFDKKFDFFNIVDRTIYYLLSYYNTLRTNGYDIEKIDLIGLTDLAILAGDEYYNSLLNSTTPEETSKIVEKIRMNIEKNYSFISSEKYWTGIELISGSIEDSVCVENNNFNYSSWNSFAPYNQRCQGSGLRPTITLSTSNIEYSIETKTDGNGIVTASKPSANESEEITFEVTPKKGYVLGEIKVTDQDGNVITFKDYKFTMPSANVLIEATFVAENPNTMTFISIGISIAFILSLLIISINKKELN